MGIWMRVVNSMDVTDTKGVVQKPGEGKGDFTDFVTQVHCNPSYQCLVIKVIFQSWYVKDIPPKRHFMACCRQENTGQMALCKVVLPEAMSA